MVHNIGTECAALIGCLNRVIKVVMNIKTVSGINLGERACLCEGPL